MRTYNLQNFVTYEESLDGKVNSNHHIGVGYYPSYSALTTVTISVSENFVGNISIQGSLHSSPTALDWTTIETFSKDDADESNIITKNLYGNFPWIRSSIHDFESGSVNYIRISYI